MSSDVPLSEKGSTATRLAIRLLPYALRRWRGLIAVMASLLMATAVDLVKPWPMKLVVDHVFGEEAMPAWAARLLTALPGSATPSSLLAWAAATTILLFLVGWAVSVARSQAGIGFGQRMVYDLASDLFAHLQRLSLAFHARKSTGDSIRRVTKDCGCVATIVQGALLPLVSSLVTLLAMFVVMWKLDWALTLLAVAVVPPMLLVFRAYAGRMLERSTRQQDADGTVYSLVERSLTAVPVIQGFAQERRVDREFRSAVDEALDAAEQSMRCDLQFKILMGLTTALGSAAVLWVGGQRVFSGDLTLGGILVFLSYLASLYGPLNSLMYTSSTLQSAGGSARRVLEVLDTRCDVVDQPDAPDLPPVLGQVQVEGVTAGYVPGRPVLHAVHLAVQPGQTVALVGASGAGKSTLAALIGRLLDPWQGRVLFDGHDLRQVSLASVRRQVAVVPQEPFLFPTTIRANLAYGRPDATAEQITAAVRAANADEFIGALPDGYETIVGQRGATLSGGQRQRIAIARALLLDAPILILDEPTSALDVRTEATIAEALRRLRHGRTCFIIAHRLSTIIDADLIVVLEDGHVVEQGDHQQLLARGGRYALFHRRQFSGSRIDSSPAGHEAPALGVAEDSASPVAVPDGGGTE